MMRLTSAGCDVCQATLNEVNGKALHKPYADDCPRSPVNTAGPEQHLISQPYIDQSRDGSYIGWRYRKDGSPFCVVLRCKHDENRSSVNKNGLQMPTAN